MTREEVIEFGKRKYGERWIADMAKDIGCATSTVMRLVTGETPAVLRRMELEIKELIRKHRFEALARPEARYE